MYPGPIMYVSIDILDKSVCDVINLMVKIWLYNFKRRSLNSIKTIIKWQLMSLYLIKNSLFFNIFCIN
jgi:hypothetical protein